MSDRYWPTEEQMARLEPLLPKSQGRSRVDDQRVLSGIIFVNRNGLRWRDAPAEYGTTQDPLQPLEAPERHGVFTLMMRGLAAWMRGGERCGAAASAFR